MNLNLEKVYIGDANFIDKRSSYAQALRRFRIANGIICLDSSLLEFLAAEQEVGG